MLTEVAWQRPAPLAVAARRFSTAHALLNAVCCLPQVPAYLRRNKQTIALEKQQLEEYIKLREQPVSGETVGR